MTSTTSGEGNSYKGGAGGKVRKRPYRRPQSRPYDRPPPPSIPSPRNNGWLPKLVDPASKLIFSSARQFFSSVFRKRLPPEANQESRDWLQDAVTNSSPRVEAPTIDDGGNPTGSFDDGGISKIEQILKKKTFSRSEVDRLTELLHSRTNDLPNGDDHGIGEVNISEPVSAYEIQHGSSSPMQDLKGRRSHGGHISTPLISSQVCEEALASPAELAKAYMGSKPSKVSPSMLGLRSQALREDAYLLDNVSFPPRTPVRVGIPDNGSLNPRSGGRSALYNMARSPYSKGSGSLYDGHGGPSASPSLYAWEHDVQHGSKQMALKRRSSALEDDIGSITPIRRLRQKTSLSTPLTLSLPVYRSPLSSRGTRVGSNGARPPISSTQKPFPGEEHTYRTLHTFGENEDNIPSTSYTPVPSKSSEMATRILQQLEQLVPKEKTLEGKVVTGRYKSPSKLIPSMLRGQALRSLEDVDSTKILQNALDNHKLEGLRDTSLLDAGDTPSQKQDKVEENGPNTSIVSCETGAPAVTSETTFSVEDAGVNTTYSDSIVTPPLIEPPQKKWAFHMSAHEDYLDLDDEIHSSEATSTPLSQEKEKQEKFMVESKVAYSEAVMANKISTVSEIKPPDGPLIQNSADLGTSDASVVGEKSTSFSFHTVPASSTNFQPVVATFQSTSAFDTIIPLKELNSTPAFLSSDSKSVDKVPSLSFSFSSAVSESLGINFTAPTESKPESKPESSNSFANIASGSSVIAQKVSESDKGDIKDRHKSGEMAVQSEISSSTALSASSIFTSFGAPANVSGLSNGSLSSSPSIFSSPAPESIDFTNQKFGNSFTNTAPSTDVTITTNSATTSSASNGNVSASSASSSFPSAPIFSFGTTFGGSSNPVSTVSTASSLETTDMKTKSEKESTSFGTGSLNSAPIFSFGPTFGASSNPVSTVSTASSLETTDMKTKSEKESTFGMGSLSSAPIFSFGPTFGASSNPVSTVSTASNLETTDMKTKSEKESAFGTGNLSSAPFGGTSFGTASTGSSIFGFSASATSSADNLSKDSPFGATSGSLALAQAPPAETGVAMVTQSMPVQFGSSFTSTSSLFGSSNSSSPLFGSSTSPNLFKSTSSFTPSSSSASSSQANTISSSGAATSSWQPVTTPFTSVSPSTVFAFGASSASVATTNFAPMVFGSSNGGPTVFGSGMSPFTALSGNGDQMSMEDSMSEDPLQGSAPAIGVFGQPPISAPASGFGFGSTVTSGGFPSFQFGNQQNQITPQMPPPFQPSGSLEFGANNSFSLGSGNGAGDKSGRKIIKVKHKTRRRP